MKLLIVTQKIDQADPVLGFFVEWVRRLANNFDQITVICLGKGEYSLPGNVAVFSLGKEELKIKNWKLKISAKLKYVWNFYRHIFKFRHDYDRVFVHMNQEYVLLAGVFWRLWGKKIILWRNHPKGSVLTRLTVSLSNLVMCTSPYSYTARFKKTILMPAGVDTELFKPVKKVVKKPNSLLFLGRLSRIKKVDLFIKTLLKLDEEGDNFTATIVGSPTNSEEESYREELLKLGQSLVDKNKLVFVPGVPPNQTVDFYNKHQIYLNLTPTGSFDKTIIEAMACETIVLVANESLASYVPKKLIIGGSESEMAESVRVALALGAEEAGRIGEKLRSVVVQNHSLGALISQLTNYLSMI